MQSSNDEPWQPKPDGLDQSSSALLSNTHAFMPTPQTTEELHSGNRSGAIQMRLENHHRLAQSRGRIQDGAMQPESCEPPQLVTRGNEAGAPASKPKQRVSGTPAPQPTPPHPPPSRSKPQLWPPSATPWLPQKAPISSHRLYQLVGSASRTNGSVSRTRRML